MAYWPGIPGMVMMPQPMGPGGPQVVVNDVHNSHAKKKKKGKKYYSSSSSSSSSDSDSHHHHHHRSSHKIVEAASNREKLREYERLKREKEIEAERKKWKKQVLKDHENEMIRKHAEEEENKKKLKEVEKAAVEAHAAKVLLEAEKKKKEKAEKEKLELEGFKQGLKEVGYADDQIEALLKMKKAKEEGLVGGALALAGGGQLLALEQPVYRYHIRYLAPEVLTANFIGFSMDPFDDKFVILEQSLDPALQDLLFARTVEFYEKKRKVKLALNNGKEKEQLVLIRKRNKKSIWGFG